MLINRRPREVGNVAGIVGLRRAFAKRVGQLLVIVSLLALSGIPAAAARTAEGDGSAVPAAVGTPLVGFDAVGTQAERRGWKHLGLRKGFYVVFNDGGIFELGTIHNKWPFLPAQFTSNIDAASIVFAGSKWKYTFVKGTEAIIFLDSGLIAGPLPYTALWPFLGPELRSGLDALTEHSENGTNVHMVSSGESFAIFNDNGAVLAQGLIRQRWPFLPGQFLANLDDASIEPENGGWKISFYKNNERIVFQDTGRIFEDVACTSRWPFLSSFLSI